MAYEGYLVKIGNYTLPHKYIAAESYLVTNYGQDLDSYQDTDGFLHRQALENQAPKFELETRNMLNDDELWDLLSNIQANYIDAVEKKASVKLYIPELHKYITNDMYFADMPIKIYRADKNGIQYQSFRIAAVSYGVKTI